MATRYKYITPTNWKKYQSPQKGGVPWVKDYVDKEADKEYVRLTSLQRYVFDGLCRLRGRLARNVDNDPTYIARALQMLPRDRTHVPQAIHTLVTRGLLTLSNQRDEIQEKKRRDQKREDQTTTGEGGEKNHVSIPTEEEPDELA